MGEATIAYAPKGNRPKERTVDVLTGEISERPSLWSMLDEDDRAERNTARSAARSRSRLRRFVVHNRLTKMWVLTNADVLDGPEGYAEMVRRLSSFVRRLRRDFFRGKAFPYLWSIEPHPEGHGWHANLLLRSVYIDKRQLQRCWSHGNVWFTDFLVDNSDHWGRPIGGKPRSDARASGHRRGSRRAAGYVSKYVTKDFGRADIGEGTHRYDVAQGFQPVERASRHDTFAEATSVLEDVPGFGALEWEWRSSDDPDWLGWPCRVVWFDPPVRSRRVKGARRKSSVPISADP